MASENSVDEINSTIGGDAPSTDAINASKLYDLEKKESAVSDYPDDDDEVYEYSDSSPEDDDEQEENEQQQQQQQQESRDEKDKKNEENEEKKGEDETMKKEATEPKIHSGFTTESPAPKKDPVAAVIVGEADIYQKMDIEDKDDTRSLGSASLVRRFGEMDVVSLMSVANNHQRDMAKLACKRPLDNTLNEQDDDDDDERQNRERSSSASSWDMVNSVADAKQDSASTASSWGMVSVTSRKKVKSSIDDEKDNTELEEAWIYLDDDEDDDRSIANSTITESTTAKHMKYQQRQSQKKAPPKFDFLGVELDLKKPAKVDDDEGLSVSLCSTILAKGSRKCPHCTFLNKPTDTYCTVCGLPLISNPTPQADEQLAYQYALSEYNRASNADIILAQTLQREEEECLRQESGSKDYDEDDDISIKMSNTSSQSTATRATNHQSLNVNLTAPALNEAHKLRELLMKFELPGDIASITDFSKCGLSFIQICQEFFERREVFKLQGKSTHVCTGFLFDSMDVESENIPFTRRIEDAWSRLERMEGGKETGILTGSNPYSTDLERKMGVLCIFVKGFTRTQYDEGVDSIVSKIQRRLLLRRTDQCVPLIWFPLRKLSDGTLLGHEGILDVQADLQNVLDTAFNCGIRTRLPPVDKWHNPSFVGQPLGQGFGVRSQIQRPRATQSSTFFEPKSLPNGSAVDTKQSLSTIAEDDNDSQTTMSNAAQLRDSDDEADEKASVAKPSEHPEQSNSNSNSETPLMVSSSTVSLSSDQSLSMPPPAPKNGNDFSPPDKRLVICGEQSPPNEGNFNLQVLVLNNRLQYKCAHTEAEKNAVIDHIYRTFERTGGGFTLGGRDARGVHAWKRAGKDEGKKKIQEYLQRIIKE